MSTPTFEEIDQEQIQGPSILKLNDGNCIKLESVSNFRSLGGFPIGGSDGQLVVRPGVICRSASPTNATFSDEFWLLEVLNVKTLVDLRTSWENKTISPVRKFEDNFIQYSIKKEEASTSPKSGSRSPNSDKHNGNTLNTSNNSNKLNTSNNNNTLNTSNSNNNNHSNTLNTSNSNNNGYYIQPPAIFIQSPEGKQKEMEEQRNGILWRIYNRNLTPDELTKLRSHSSGALRKRYCIPLINSKFFLEGVYHSAPENTKLKCTAARYLLFNDNIGAYMLMDHLNNLGIIEMYKLTLMYTQEEILTIMRIFKNKENYPIMYFCSLGKDRTGMTTAILLSCLGVPRDIIIEDYAKSELNIAPFMEQIRRYFTRVGLSKEEFVRSHRETMAGLLTWIDEAYGSMDRYLECIGFSLEEQQELRDNLIVTKQEYDNFVNEKVNSPNLQKKHDDYIQAQKSKKPPPKLLNSPRFWRKLSFSKDLTLSPTQD
ncbi:hypothetical protein CYY_001118 [Polysphondylium violaceum]|uniref:Protein tyrosine phosphatase n=1 Tax=Polysphondylium violaceum TaxID=133409 RepID=A0A8J4Q3N4_9MYCE|nr:hypothetical protein CYY_001118 [Polysphondylium violaceum]